MRKFSYFIILVAIHLLYGCGDKTNSLTNSLEVTATAYTSNPKETDSTPSLAAWGDTLRPGMNAISVSRDLIKMGLCHGVEVSIDGLEGKYKVLDKMNKRWRRKIDIYMGKDIKKAKDWGKRKVVIHWVSEPS